MGNRHKYKKGGRVVYEGKGSHVEHEAEEGTGGHKRGGKVTHASGHKGKHRFARGGRTGSDNHPFSSAFVGPSGGGK